MYNFKKIEKKWQDIWENEKAFVCENNSDKPKYYYLIEFHTHLIHLMSFQFLS